MDLAYAGAHRGEKFGPGSRKRKPQQHPVPKEQEVQSHNYDNHYCCSILRKPRCIWPQDLLAEQGWSKKLPA